MKGIYGIAVLYRVPDLISSDLSLYTWARTVKDKATS